MFSFQYDKIFCPPLRLSPFHHTKALYNESVRLSTVLCLPAVVGLNTDQSSDSYTDAMTAVPKLEHKGYFICVRLISRTLRAIRSRVRFHLMLPLFLWFYADYEA